MIESGGVAPYAPKAAVMAVINAYRDQPIPTPINTAVIEKIGVAETIGPRTLQALKLLDLLDADGNPTPALEGLRRAGSDEFRSRLADIVRAAYAEIFTYRDPATDSVGQIEDAFRHFQPVSMRTRMVRLFLGLCEEAGIIEAADRVPTGNAKNAGRPVVRKKVPKRTTVTAPMERNVANAITPVVGAIAGSDHLLMRGLLQTLPPVGAEWPDERRKEWIDAVAAAFNLIYKRPSKAQRELLPGAGGGDA